MGKKQRTLFLTPRLLLHARFVTPAKGWPVCLKVKERDHIVCTWIPSAPVRLTKLDFLFLLGAIGGSFLYWNFHRILCYCSSPISKLWSHHCALETNLCHVFCFLEFENAWLLLQKPLNSGLVVKVFTGLFTLFTIHRHSALWSVDLLKNNPQRFLTLPVSPPGLQYFSKGVCSLNVAVPRKESSSLRHFLGNNQELRTSVLKTWGSILTFPGQDTSFFPLMATSDQPGWYNFLVAARLMGT